jgi:crotonobetainyl-CoA:carnitine CoA-transferase CaiB-like acyl-CoA transferase
MAHALDGIRIVDLSHGIAGPLGVLLLAEHGADVIKVERPGGDPFRSYEGYRCWNRSRRSVILDLTLDRDLDNFRRLAATADVVVESLRPGAMNRVGLDADSLNEINPRLVVVSCPAYPAGHRLASRPGYDALVQATSGTMWEQSGWRTGPIFLHLPLPSMAACYLVAVGALAGLSARERTGRGQHVETSLLQGALLYTTQLWQEVERGGAGYHDLMAKTYPPGIHQSTLFECANHEWVHVSVLSGLPQKKSLDAILGVTGAPGDNELRRARFGEWKRDELIAELRANNHAVDAVTPPAGIFNHPQTLANGTVVTIDDPEVGPIRQMGVPIHLLGTPGEVKGPQPRPG